MKKLSNGMLRLSELNPKPIPGEWYEVLSCSDEFDSEEEIGTVPLIVLISEKPKRVIAPWGGFFSFDSFCNAKKVSKDEAFGHLKKEIKEMEKSTKGEDPVLKGFIKKTNEFLQKQFQN